LLAAALNRKADSDRPPFGPSGAFAFGYLLGWGGFSAIAVGAQWGLAELGVLSDMLVISSNGLAGGIMIIAGLWQFTPLKQACLRHCQSPVHSLTRNRRPNSRPVIMGLHHSLFCLGCCWFLMLLLFVGGVMNLFWIAGLTLYVWLEKGLPFGHRISRLAGAALILWGTGLLIWGRTPLFG